MHLKIRPPHTQNEFTSQRISSLLGALSCDKMAMSRRLFKLRELLPLLLALLLRRLGVAAEQPWRSLLTKEDALVWDRVFIMDESSMSMTPTPTQAPAGTTDLCFMLYQMADNDLDFYLREDLLELTQSKAIRNEKMTTWVYYDPEYPDPLEGAYNPDGSPITEPYAGSRYLTYKHDMQKLVVDKVLPGEQNSDREETIFQFVAHAVSDCVAKGAKEYFIAFSDHGGGALGYGGDWNLIRRRKLVAPNRNVASALKRALRKIRGAPEIFDVIGFDACNMMEFGAVLEGEYDSSLTKYYLASQALEPGTGWPYHTLVETNSALDLARNIHEQYLLENDLVIDHATMAIIDTTKLSVFSEAFEAVAEDLAARLFAADDPGISLAVLRAQEQSADWGIWILAFLDIGDFLRNIQELCGPLPASPLAALLAQAMAAYNDMFIVRGSGSLTLRSTGMSVFFPHSSDYLYEKEFLDPIVFDDPAFATREAPSWLDFMASFYNDATPSFGSSATCTVYEEVLQITLPPTSTLAPAPTFAPFTPETLAPTPTFPPFTFEPTLTPAPTSGFSPPIFPPVAPPVASPVETPTLSGPALLADEVLTSTDESVIVMATVSTTASVTVQYGFALNLPDGEFFVYGGNILESYGAGSLKMTAVWDRTFYLIGETDPRFLLYVDEISGSGAEQSSVMYFPPDTITEDTSVEGLTVEEAEALGGSIASLSLAFTETGDIDFSLYAASMTGFAFAEVLPDDEGFIVPIVRKGNIFPYDESLGAFSNAVVPWSSDVRIVAVSLDQIPEFLPIDAASADIVISLGASDTSSGQTQETVLDTVSSFTRA